MKKSIALLIAILMLFTLVACGGGNQAQTSGSQAQTGDSQAQTGGSQAQTGGSQAQTGGSQAQTGGGQAQTGGSQAQTDADALAAALETMKPMEITFVSMIGSTNYLAEAMVYWHERVEEVTNGKIKVNRYHDDTLLASADIYPALLDGIIDMGEGDPSYTTSYFPLLSVFYLSGFSFDSFMSATHAFNDLLRSDLDELKDMKWLFGYSMPASDLLSAVRIEKLEDLKGVQVRTTGFTTDTISRLGGTPVALATSEIYDALLKGTVDCTLMNATGLQPPRLLGEVTKYIVKIPGISTLPHFCGMTWDTWNAIPPAVQDAIEQINLETVDLLAEINKVNYDIAINRWVYEEGTHELIEIPMTEMQRWYDLLADQTDAWIADANAQGLDGDGAVALMREITDRNNALYPTD